MQVILDFWSYLQSAEFLAGLYFLAKMLVYSALIFILTLFISWRET